jgi:UDP-N-acetylmuramyl pentapeptide phosphotransferase/UDP-N-acetylglucosamine-1-phosphate transferase
VLRRINYRGKRVAYPLGALLLVAVLAALAADFSRWLVFLAGVGCLGLIDDLVDSAPRGWRGHTRAVARGELSTGALKAIGTLGLAAYAAAGGGATGAGYVADIALLTLAAHLGNLLDTRPGRTEKALALTASVCCAASSSLAPVEPIAPLVVPVVLGAWFTLHERAMLGDSGASVIGGMAGIVLVTTMSQPVAAIALAGLIAISLYGEFRSISSAIERIPLLDRLDSLGRAN